MLNIAPRAFQWENESWSLDDEEVGEVGESGETDDGGVDAAVELAGETLDCRLANVGLQSRSDEHEEVVRADDCRDREVPG